MDTPINLSDYLPPQAKALDDAKTGIPRIAKNAGLLAEIDEAVQKIPTRHQLYHGDSVKMSFIPDNSVHLVLTSPPYWTLKKYLDHRDQLGDVVNYQEFIDKLGEVWRHCYRALVPGGRLICVVGDVCLSRKNNNGRHTVVPLHASIQEQCRLMGFDNLAPIIWHKIANAKYEAGGSGGFLGKPYEPNGVVKNDIEYILMQRKPGAYRSPSEAARILSTISADNHKQWFQSIWSGLNGASTRGHPAPYPEALAERLIRMYSFVGDTVLDPFIGSGTTSVMAARRGRNSAGIEIEPRYFELTEKRIRKSCGSFFSKAEISTTVVASPR